MRIAFSLLTLLLAAPLAGSDLHFVTPLAGGQVLGPTRVEVATTEVNIDRIEFFVDGVLASVARQSPFAIVHDFGETIAEHRIAARLSSNGYRNRREISIVTAALSVAEQIAVDLVEVPLRIRSRKSAGAADLELRENGTSQKILELRRGRSATRFVFVVDRSLSMGGGKLTAALRAIERALPQLRSDDDAQIIFFNHQVSAPRGLGAGNALSPAPSPSGGTSLRDALASFKPARRTVAIVISDGDDRNSSLGTDDALRRIGRSNVVVYALLLGEGNASGFLDRASRTSGGSSVRSTRERLAKDLERIFSDLNSRYTAVYQSSATSPGWRSIEVRPRNRSTEIVSARPGYYAAELP